ncbi:MAG: YraN family protein [Alphaproteobacteria bacterium]
MTKQTAKKTPKNSRQERGRQAWRRGLAAEWIGAAWLSLRGYRILARRYRTPVGEVDMVIARGGTIAFVEVKARSNLADAAEAISMQQRQRVANGARYFMKQHPQYGDHALRFDAILVRPWRLPSHLAAAWWLDP